MRNPNAFLNDMARRARAAGGPSNLVLARFIDLVNCGHAFDHVLEAWRKAGGDRAEETRARSRVTAVRWHLHRQGHSGGYRIGGVAAQSLDRVIERGVPLESRGTKLPEGAAGYVRQARSDRIAYQLSRDGMPNQAAWTALRHFMSLRGFRRPEAEIFFSELAANFSRNVRSLVQVRFASRPFWYGYPRDFMLTDGSTGNRIGRRKGGGVWVERIHRPDRDGGRKMEVVFCHCGGKQEFRALVPVDCDPETVDLVPPRPDNDPGVPDSHGQIVGEILALAGDRFDEDGLNSAVGRALRWGFLANGHDGLAFGDSRLGRARRGRFCNKKGRWVFGKRDGEAGVWLHEWRPEMGAVVVAFEPVPGDVTYRLAPLSALLKHVSTVDWSVHPDDVSEDGFMAGLYRIAARGDRRPQGLLVDGWGLDAEWYLAESGIAAMAKRRAHIQDKAMAA